MHQGFELYGSDRSFLSSVRVLRSMYPSATIDVVVPKEGPLAAELRRSGVTVVVAPLGTVRSDDARKPLAAIGRTIRKTTEAVRVVRNYDVLYVNTVVVADYILASRFIDRPSIVHVREIPSSFAEKLVLSTLLWLSSARMVFNSQRTARSYWLPRARTGTCIHNGVKGFLDVSSIPREDGILRLLHIGRINTWKGQDLLLDSLSLLPKDLRKQVSVRIVGETAEGKVALRHALEERIRRLGLSELVEIHPFANDPRDHFEWADVVVVPSTRPEPFGRVATEAMSAGRATVAAAHGGLLEIVDHERTGLLFHPNDADRLAACIERLASSPEQVHEMGRESRARFLERFSIATYEKNLRAIFERVFGRESDHDVSSRA